MIPWVVSAVKLGAVSFRRSDMAGSWVVAGACSVSAAKRCVSEESYTAPDCCEKISIDGKLPQSRGVQHLDLFAAQAHPTLRFEVLQQSAHDLAQAAQLVGQGLVGDPDGARLGGERGGQTLVQFLEGDGRDQLQQIRHAFGKTLEDEVPE